MNNTASTYTQMPISIQNTALRSARRGLGSRAAIAGTRMLMARIDMRTIFCMDWPRCAPTLDSVLRQAGGSREAGRASTSQGGVEEACDARAVLSRHSGGVAAKSGVRNQPEFQARLKTSPIRTAVSTT